MQKSSPVHEDWDTTRAAELIAASQALEGPLLPILHSFVETFGYVPEPAEPMIAEALNLSRAEVHGVLTFYHDFRREPAGDHVVKLCRAEACQAAGCEVLADHLTEKLGIGFGQTTRDGRITLEPVYCLGLCAVSPAAMIDGRLVARLDAGKLDRALEEVAR